MKLFGRERAVAPLWLVLLTACWGTTTTPAERTQCPFTYARTQLRVNTIPGEGYTSEETNSRAVGVYARWQIHNNTLTRDRVALAHPTSALRLPNLSVCPVNGRFYTFKKQSEPRLDLAREDRDVKELRDPSSTFSYRYIVLRNDVTLYVSLLKMLRNQIIISR